MTVRDASDSWLFDDDQDGRLVPASRLVWLLSAFLAAGLVVGPGSPNSTRSRPAAAGSCRRRANR